MQKLIVFLSSLLIILSPFADVEEALVLLKSNRPKAIKILERDFDHEEDVEKRAEISYLISLDSSQKTQKSMTYYVKNTLQSYKNLNEAERYRLYRYLAELSFKQGDLKTALEYYEVILAKPEHIKGIEDYLTLQRSWVLINLNRYSEATSYLSKFLKEKTGKLQDIMSYDLGKFMAESLALKEVSRKQKSAIKQLAKENEVKSEEFYAGLIAGFNRGREVKDKRKKFEAFVIDSGYYDAFYAYALLNHKFQKKNPCDFLDWKLPTMVSVEVANLMVKKSFNCHKRENEVKKLMALVQKFHDQSLELALLQEKFGNSKVCSTVLNLLKSESEDLNKVLKISGTHCHHEKYQKSYINTWSSLSSIKKESVAKNPEAMYLNAVIAFERDDSSLAELLLPLDNKLSTFGPSQKRNLLIMAFKAKKITLAGKWLKKNPELLYHRRIYPLAINHAKELGSIHRDPILVFLRQDATSQKIGFGIKDLKRIKSHVSEEVYQNLKLYRELAVLEWQAVSMKTLKAQDRFFFQAKRMVKKMSNHKWLNEKLKTRFIYIFKETLKKGTYTLSRHQTEISKALGNVLSRWEASL